MNVQRRQPGVRRKTGYTCPLPNPRISNKLFANKAGTRSNFLFLLVRSNLSNPSCCKAPELNISYSNHQTRALLVYAFRHSRFGWRQNPTSCSTRPLAWLHALPDSGDPAAAHSAQTVDKQEVPQEASKTSATAATNAQAQTVPELAEESHQAGLAGTPAGRDSNKFQAVDPAMEDLLKLVALLPSSVRTRLEALPQLSELIEVVMDLGRPPLARFRAGEIQLCEDIISIEDINFAVAQVGNFDGDNRAGIDCTLHRISCIRNRAGKVIGLTCRAGRAISGSAALVEDLVRANKSILLLGRPGVGKTTAIRDIARTLADSCQKRVVIVDTSNEIGGDGDIPHRGIGSARRMQVAHPQEQHKVMIEAVENHMPQVIIIDEISTMAECDAARTIAQRGVQLVATAHGQELENLIKNPSLQDLIGGIQTVTLGDESAKKRGTQKSILERSAPPTFDVAIEMTERDQWTIHLDVGTAVDEILLGGSPRGQIRERDGKGNVKAVTQFVRRRYINDNNLDNWGAGAASGIVTYHKLREKNMSTGEWVSRPFSPTPWITTGGSSAYDDNLLPKPARQPGAPAEVGAFISTSSSNFSLQHSSPSPSLSNQASSPFAPLTASSDLPDEDKMKVLFVMDDRNLERVRAIVRQLDTGRRVQEVTDLEVADVLVASRKSLRNNTKIRNAAKKLQVPIYVVKASSSSGVMRDLCPLLGLEPCPEPSSSTSSSSSEMDSMDDDDEDAADFSDEASMEVSNRSQATHIRTSSSTSGGGGSGRAVSGSASSNTTTCAEDWAALLASTVRELRYQPVDREFATRVLTSFLEELPESTTGALATMSWALAYTKNKKRFLESSGGSLQILADAITPRLPEFKPSELVQVATGFAALKYYPGDDFWDALESGSRKHVGKMSEREIKAVQTSFQVLDSLRIMSEVTPTL